MADVIDLLVTDHKEVNALFGRYRRASKADTKEKLAREIVKELSVHAAVEEQFVYPLVRARVDGGGDLASHSIEEHQELKRLLANLEKAQVGKAAFDRTMDKVVATVHEHVQDEEQEMFPKLRKATDSNLRKRVGSVAEKAKSVVPTHPHPLVPGTATAQLVAGPWASIMDRARDLF